MLFSLTGTGHKSNCRVSLPITRSSSAFLSFSFHSGFFVKQEVCHVQTAKPKSIDSDLCCKWFACVSLSFSPLQSCDVMCHDHAEMERSSGLRTRGRQLPIHLFQLADSRRAQRRSSQQVGHGGFAFACFFVHDLRTAYLTSTCASQLLQSLHTPLRSPVATHLALASQYRHHNFPPRHTSFHFAVSSHHFFTHPSPPLQHCIFRPSLFTATALLCAPTPTTGPVSPRSTWHPRSCPRGSSSFTAFTWSSCAAGRACRRPSWTPCWMTWSRWGIPLSGGRPTMDGS